MTSSSESYHKNHTLCSIATNSGRVTLTDSNLTVTILSARGEQAHRIGEIVQLCGMEWDWLRIPHATELSSEEIKFFKSTIHKIYDCILNYENVLIHCSAGLHRTGMFAYALLRKGSVEHRDTLQIIKNIRPETFEALEEKYIQFANELRL